MLYKNAKQVVIIKDIHSNIFEEVIFVLKNNTDVIKNAKKQDKLKSSNVESDYIIKEAHQIIDNYIRQYTRNYKEAVQTPKVAVANKQLVKSKNKSMGIFLNAALFISISVLILLLSRAF